MPRGELGDVGIEARGAQTRIKRRSREVAPYENALSTILTFGKAVGRERFGPSCHGSMCLSRIGARVELVRQAPTSCFGQRPGRPSTATMSRRSAAAAIGALNINALRKLGRTPRRNGRSKKA